MPSNTTQTNTQNPVKQHPCDFEYLFTITKSHPEEGSFIARHLSDQDLAALSNTSRFFFNSTLPDRNKRGAKKLLSHVVKGEQIEAQAMIGNNPGLLLIQSEAIDYSGRTIRGSAFQAAIGAGDKPMWEMMLNYFESLEQGEALRQFQEQFPNGIEDEKAAPELIDDYKALALAIISDDDKGLSKIEAFRQVITHQKEITHGKHFNLQHLLAAYQAYIDNFDNLANWPNRQIFWQKVIGYVQRQMTCYDAQIQCFGVKKVLENETSFERSLKFHGKDSVFFPLTFDSGLGFDYACYGELHGKDSTIAPPCSIEPLKKVIEAYLKQKQLNLKDLQTHLSKECPINELN